MTKDFLVKWRYPEIKWSSNIFIKIIPNYLKKNFYLHWRNERERFFSSVISENAIGIYLHALYLSNSGIELLYSYVVLFTGNMNTNQREDIVPLFCWDNLFWGSSCLWNSLAWHFKVTKWKWKIEKITWEKKESVFEGEEGTC